MEIKFWEQRWLENQIAFHLPTVNPYSINYWGDFNIGKGSQVFVPLCGKTADLAWLANKQMSVLGLECSEKAIEDFFTEQKLISEKSISNDFITHSSKNISILQGDFFKLGIQNLADVSIVYDRASLIALPENMRNDYVALLHEILPSHAQIFLITLEYNQAKMSGPPFSVPMNEVERLYGNAYYIQVLHEGDVLEGHQKFKERGLDYLLERVYKLTRK